MKDKVKASWHNHSRFSGKIFIKWCTPDKIARRAILGGLEILAITDINNDEAVDYMLNRKREYKIEPFDSRGAVIENQFGKKIYLLRGIEFHGRQGHVLSVGHKGKMHPEKNYSAVDIIKLIQDRGGLPILAHPFNTAVGGVDKETLDRIKREIHRGFYIEVFNAQSILVKNLNEMAECYAAENNIRGVVGSDSQRDNEVCSSYSVFNRQDINFLSGDKLIDSIRTALDSGNYQNHEGYVPLWSFLSWIAAVKLTTPRELIELPFLACKIVKSKL